MRSTRWKGQICSNSSRSFYKRCLILLHLTLTSDGQPVRLIVSKHYYSCFSCLLYSEKRFWVFILLWFLLLEKSILNKKDHFLKMREQELIVSILQKIYIHVANYTKKMFVKVLCFYLYYLL